MNFEILSDITAMHQYDEIKIIGRDVCCQGKPYHFAAMVRKAEQAQLFVLGPSSRDRASKEGLPSGLHSSSCQERTMRQRMKQLCGVSFSFLSKLKTDCGELNFTSAQSGSLEPVSQDDFERTLLFAKLMDAGWKLPEDSVFFSENWERIQCQQYQFEVPSQKLPRWNHACAVWQPETKEYYIEKPVRLRIEDERAGLREQAQIPFSITDEHGVTRDGICYINRVKRADVWEEQKKVFENPEYKRNALIHMTASEFERMKQDTWNTLEQSCPRGMYFVCVEYECTLDVSLEFYASNYLNSMPKVPAGHASSITFLSKPDVPEGVHGLKLRADVIQMPVTEYTKEIQAEVFKGYETFPEREGEIG